MSFTMSILLAPGRGRPCALPAASMAAMNEAARAVSAAIATCGCGESTTSENLRERRECGARVGLRVLYRASCARRTVAVGPFGMADGPPAQRRVPPSRDGTGSARLLRKKALTRLRQRES
eukprot:scaffold297251_cov26-Tisochrysis_lutea.AAC.9